MTFRALAKALRRRQLRAGLQPKSAIRALSDAALLDCYLECGQCRARLFATPESERMAVAVADSAEHFCELVNRALAAHDCPAKKPEHN